MRGRSESTWAIWLVCTGIGLLFLARGAFQPYVFPLFANVAGLGYEEIAFLTTVYVLAQSVCAPLAGWFTDRTSVRLALATAIAFGLAGFLIIAAGPDFAVCGLAVFVVGLAFVLGKIALNTILVVHSSAEILRRSVAKRATLLNLGSFVGNSIAVQVTAHLGYTVHAMLLGVLHLPLVIGLAAPAAPSLRATKKTWGIASLKALCKNRGFLADSLRRFAVVLPYGCWGTIIPKYVIDQYGSNDPVWFVYLTSLCTTVVGTHFLAVYLSGRLYAMGFKWEWWSLVSVGFYCAGLLLLVFAIYPAMLPLAVFVFICGEVVMTPCFDETAKKHSKDADMGTCMGLLHLVDGLGRMLGAAFALAVYGWMRTTPYEHYFWLTVVSVFLVGCLALHVIAWALARSHAPAAKPVGPQAQESSPKPALERSGS
jgi:MFS family permease